MGEIWLHLFGIKISSDLKELRKLNFTPICISVKGDLERWQNLFLYLFLYLIESV